MHRTEPKVYMVAETQVNQPDLLQYLIDIGALSWHTDSSKGCEVLIEIFGRMCYRSFDPQLNPNLTKIRQGNKQYIGNIIKSKHGSVFEHATASFIFHDVSRVFTHELVRHRAGTAMSQESLRYVRLADLGLWLPSCIKEKPEIVELFETTFESLEKLQLAMADAYGLDEEGVGFAEKKAVTSAMRRLAPVGLSTTIGFTMNHRALRHILVMRTSRHAEEEMRKVFSQVGNICVTKWQNLYQDFKYEEVDGYLEFTTENDKI